MMNRLFSKIGSSIAGILDKAIEGKEVSIDEGVRLLETTDSDLMALIWVADELRRRTVRDLVTFVHNRNINFTNYCEGSCLFCGFRKRPGESGGFLLSLDQIVAKAEEAQALGATEVCIQGGLNPSVDPRFYLRICEAVRSRSPQIHIHAFSPMEVAFAAGKMGCPISEFLRELKASGLSSIPGTAAEILDDSIRQIICPGKLSTSLWREVIVTAHRMGIPSSATMMYGHVETPRHQASHMDLIRKIQKETGGFTEFVPLSFIYPNTDLFRRGLCGRGTSGISELKIHAVARIMLNGLIDNIQVSWVKLGKRLAQICLSAGGNDLGGTLMEEQISRSAGGSGPTHMGVEDLRAMIRSIGRTPAQRTTTYDLVEEQNLPQRRSGAERSIRSGGTQVGDAT